MGTYKKINICHLISGDLWAGAEVQMYTLVTSLKSASNFNISAIVLNEEKLALKLRQAGFEVTVIEESKYNFLQILGMIKRTLQDKKIDILHTHRFKENILGARLKKSGLVRYLVQTVHGIPEPAIGIKKLKTKVYSYLNLYHTKKYFDKIVTVSFDIQKKLGAKIGSNKLVTVHNVVNPENVIPQKASSIIREEFEVGENQPLIGTVGRMVPVKGYNLFLNMAKIILKSNPEAKFILAGDGPLKPELEKKAHELGIDKNVLFPGFRDDVADIINSLDVFVITSYHEGIPMALLEAMTLKKAIVATAVGGINEIIEKNISGVLTDSGDARALAEACLKVLNDADFKARLEAAAELRVKTEFSLSSQKNQVLNLYTNLINSP